MKHKLTLSITGKTSTDWQAKLQEAQKLNISLLSLFLELYEKQERNKIYKALKSSCIKTIPFVHVRHDMDKDEFKYLKDNFGTKMFNIHEFSFNHLEKWRGIQQMIYLELNTDNHISDNLDIKRIGGFCIDLAHFKKSEESWTEEFEYVLNRRRHKHLFRCNHISGYSYEENTDLHTVNETQEFDYLKSIPEFVLGEVMAIEVFNSLNEQMEFADRIESLLPNTKLITQK